MVRVSVLVRRISLFSPCSRSRIHLHVERLPCQYLDVESYWVPREANVIAVCTEQHRQCRAPWQAPGSRPSFLQGRRQVPQRYAAPRYVF